MAVFKKAPVTEAPPETPSEQATNLLSGIGIETGIPGAVMLAVGGILLVIALFQFIRVIRARSIRLAEGEVVGTEHASGGGYHPVVRFTDEDGQRRRFVAPVVVPSEQTGQRLRVRIDGPRPVIVPRPPSPFREAMSMVLPLVLGGAIAATGLTGQLAGIVPLPFF